MSTVNTVSQPIAEELHKAGWAKPTYFIYAYDEIRGVGPVWDLAASGWGETPVGTGWLPAPNISELREELNWADFVAYWQILALRSDKVASDLDVWIYTVTASADELAKIWLWKEETK